MRLNKDGVAKQFGPVMWRQLFLKISRKCVRGPRTRRDDEGFSFYSNDTDSNVRVILK